MINEERLLNLFLKLQSFDSLSFHENDILDYVYNNLKELGLYLEKYQVMIYMILKLDYVLLQIK